MIPNWSPALLALLMADKHSNKTAIGDPRTAICEHDLQGDYLELLNRYFSHGRLHSFGFESARVYD